MLRPLLLTMAVAGVALLWAACGGGASSFQPGVINCEPLFESQRYRFELRVLVDLKEFSGEPTDDDRYPPEGFKLDQVISGIADEGNIDATIRYPDLDNSEVHLISVGSVFWTLVEDEWVAHQITPESPLPIPYLPLSLCGLLDRDLDLGGVEDVSEAVGGTKAHRYTLDGFPTELAATIWSAESDMGRLITEYSGDVWAADDGSYPLKVELTGNGFYTSGRELATVISMEVSDRGSSDINVEAPTKS